jgi:hypothetical protein
MRFQVPQFIEVEDKIFGQLTLKQFIYLAGGAGLSFIIYTILDNFLLTLIPAVIIMGASASLAFIKINNKPFVSIVESAFHYYFGNKLYIWKKEEKVANKKVAEQEQKNYATVMVPKISDSKLKDLTWSLDIKESLYSNKNQK